MNTFEEAVQSAREAKAAIAELETNQRATSDRLADARAKLAETETECGEQLSDIADALARQRSKLQTALAAINDAPLQDGEAKAAEQFGRLEPLTKEAGEAAIRFTS